MFQSNCAGASTGSRKSECCVPNIRLNGKWLAALGLVPGQKIRVITNGSIITIAPVSGATD
ncbi:MAG TPA: hypothetical protein DCO65_02955 [Spartobacteria bacterium]|nr:hypothetical protein [Spartobacteria bacterium]